MPISKALITPVFLWCFAFSIIDSAAYYSFIGNSLGPSNAVVILFPIAILGLLLQFFANWKIATVSYAISKLCLDSLHSFDEAHVASKEEKLAILKMSIPVFAYEGFICVCLFFAQFLTSLYYDPKGPIWTVVNVSIAWMQLVYYCSALTHMAFYTLNGYVLASASHSQLKMSDVIDHYAGSHLPSFSYFCGYLVAVTVIPTFFLVPVGIGMIADRFVPSTFWTEAILLSVLAMLTTPIATIFFAVAAVGGAFLSKQRKEPEK